jgi:structural maintenance of chromosome 4
MEHLQDRVKKLVNSKNLAESKLKALESESSDQGSAAAIEAELKGIDGKIEEQTLAAYQIKQELEQATHSLDGLKDELEELSRQLSGYEKGQGKFKKIEYELKVKIEQDEEALKEAHGLGQRCEAELRGLSLHHINLSEPRPVLTVYEDEEDLKDLVKKLGQIESQVRVLQERLEALTPNLKVLAECREKEARLKDAQDELAQLEADRQSKRDAFDSLRRARHDEFMAGFRQISAKLKEMYQLITMGGNAELELVDSLDPFSEGILFSVMPPRKSWKHIANLSGGEKTLSSLALVFALHTYRPTPIYVMDEIDAALDFRNVSIVANYIKERTRDAQFVVISLRSNMFELSDRLVGIYKTEQRTKSVTIDPKNFAVPQPSSIMTGTSTTAAVSTTN